MRYENLEGMIVAWELFLQKVLIQKADDPREKIMYSELADFCRDRSYYIQKAINNGIDEYNHGNSAAECGVKYPTYIEYVEQLQKDLKYWREEWLKDFDKLKYYQQLADKLKEMSHDAAEIISRLELELKEARESADHLRAINNKYFAQNMQLTEELMILKGEASEDGIERY